MRAYPMRALLYGILVANVLVSACGASSSDSSGSTSSAGRTTVGETSAGGATVGKTSAGGTTTGGTTGTVSRGGTLAQGGSTADWGAGGTTNVASSSSSGGGTGGTTTTGSALRIGEALADYLLATYPNYNTVTLKNWEYTNGIVYYGVSRIYDRTQNAKYLNYIKTFVDGYVDSAGTINLGSGAAARDPRILDTIQPATLLFGLYDKTHEARYLSAMTHTRDVFRTLQKNSQGGFYHKPTYPFEMWLDGIYMAEPFITRYASRYSASVDPSGADATDCYATATFQIKLLAQKLMDRQNANPTLRLPVHAWADLSGLAAASTAAPAWANTTTGRSPVLWSRAIGWWAAALVDVLEYLPAAQADRTQLTEILVDVAAGLKETQDPATGLWYQVTDRGTATDNWLETSSSALFVYALKKGVRLGVLDAQYEAVATKAWTGVRGKVVVNLPTVTVQGAVGGMGVFSSYAQYVGAKTSVLDNVPHGIASVLLAASEAEY